MDTYTVFGHPIAHSLSPKIHALFAKQTGQSLFYDTTQPERTAFPAALISAFKNGLSGANVTLPFKEQAYEVCDQLSDRAKLAKAVNTVYRSEVGLVGDNTDGIGLVRDITVNIDQSLTNKRLLILGAGGAVRGVLGPLLSLLPAEITLVNRTMAKAMTLRDEFQRLGDLTVCAAAELQQQTTPYDWIINGTSSGVTGEVPDLPANVITANTYCYDMFYSAQQTAFNQWCQQQGAVHCFDGLGMLVEQAAEAFLLWRGVRPETATVITSLRDQL